MYKHAEKVESYLRTRTRLLRWYNLKLPQLLYQGLYIIIIASVSFGDPGQCSAPLNIFLQGLFSMYIFSFSLNLILCLTRCLNSQSEGASYQRRVKHLSLRIDLCYFPLYWGFSILEFIWYILGAEWVTANNNCMQNYPNGARLTQALVSLWVLAMLAMLVGLVWVNCYLCCGKYEGSQSLGVEGVIDNRHRDAKSQPESPLKIIINPTYSNTPARLFDD